eukprot:SAG11_NODE_3613_length_2338_cov_2.821795_3_plen_450_part_01
MTSRLRRLENINPEWSEDVTFQIADPAALLTVDILDEDVAEDDDYMCGLRVPVIEWLCSPATQHWYRLQKTSTGSTAARVNNADIRRISSPLGALFVGATCEMTKVAAPSAQGLGVLSVSILEAKIGPGQPTVPACFVRVRVDQQTGQTSITEPTLRPAWAKENLEFTVYDLVHDRLTLAMYAYDSHGDHRMIGEVSFAMAAAMQMAMMKQIAAHPFHGKSGRNALPKLTGEIRFRLGYSMNPTSPTQEALNPPTQTSSLLSAIRTARYMSDSDIQGATRTARDLLMTMTKTMETDIKSTLRVSNITTDAIEADYFNLIVMWNGSKLTDMKVPTQETDCRVSLPAVSRNSVNTLEIEVYTVNSTALALLDDKLSLRDSEPAALSGPEALDPELVAQITEIFERIDKDCDGQINRRELIIALRKNPDISNFLELPSKIRQEDGSREAVEAF